jgi:hypothetical protein
MEATVALNKLAFVYPDELWFYEAELCCRATLPSQGWSRK